MNYKQTYNRLIISRKLFPLEGFGHIHHVIPRYMRGNNLPINLVKLSIREHILAHYLLWKIYNNYEDYIAFNALSGKTEDIEKMRIELAVRNSSLARKGKKIPNSHMKNKDMIGKILKTKREKYGDNLLSDKHLKGIIKALPNTIHKKEAKAKSTQYRRNLAKNMTQNERNEYYGRKGKNNNHYGKARGYYIVYNSNREKLEFKNQEEIVNKLGVSQSTLVRHRNKGIIDSKSRVKENNRWNGWEFNYYTIKH